MRHSRLLLLSPHERDEKPEPPELIRTLYADLFINIPAIGIDRAFLFSELLRESLHTDPVGHSVYDGALIGTQLSVGRKKQLILLRSKFIHPSLGQLPRIRLRLLHLPLQFLFLRLQLGDRLLAEAQLLGDGQQLLKGDLPTAALIFESVKIQNLFDVEGLAIYVSDSGRTSSPIFS